MRIREIREFSDTKPQITARSKIRCPECEDWSSYKDWTKTEIHCEDCGTHEAIECPLCYEDIDHVYCGTLETKE